MTQLFRLMMRNRPEGLGRFLPWNLIYIQLVNWLTDVTNIKPGECMSEVAWFFSGQLDGKPTLSDLKESSQIMQKLLICFNKNR